MKTAWDPIFFGHDIFCLTPGPKATGIITQVAKSGWNACCPKQLAS